MRSLTRNLALILVVTLIFTITIPIPARAEEYSIPVTGRFATSRITLAIPPTPKWAHDTLSNASLVWNRGQLWFQHTYSPDGNVFTFTESNPANATINYALPPPCIGLAVGWTEYDFARSSNTIISARIFLDPVVFSASQEENMTARQYAFRVALHELGRVLGLGSVLDVHDIMDPIGTPNRIWDPPTLSTLDLYAVHVLASDKTYTSPIVLNTDQYQLLNAWDLLSDKLMKETQILSSKLAGSPSLSPPPPTSNDVRNPEDTNCTIANLIVYAIVLSAAFVAPGMRFVKREYPYEPCRGSSIVSPLADER